MAAVERSSSTQWASRRRSAGVSRTHEPHCRRAVDDPPPGRTGAKPSTRGRSGEVEHQAATTAIRSQTNEARPDEAARRSAQACEADGDERRCRGAGRGSSRGPARRRRPWSGSPGRTRTRRPPASPPASASPPTMVAPERETPGIIARHWKRPMARAVPQRQASSGRARRGAAPSDRRPAGPRRRRSATSRSAGGLSNRTALMKSCSSTPRTTAGQEGDQHARREAAAPPGRWAGAISTCHSRAK